MGEKGLTKPEIASQKITIKLPPAIGDWTTYRSAKPLLKKVKTGLYGFDRLSKKELNQFLVIHYRFIQELFQHFKIDLALGIEFIACQVEQTTYLNFLRSLAGPMLQGKISIAGVHENTQVYFDLNLANSIINHALGSRDLEPLNRGLTEAESSVFTTTINEHLKYYDAAFNEVVSPSSFAVVSSPDITLDPTLSPSTTFVCFSAEASFNDNPPGKIYFGYSASTLKKLLLKYFEKEAAKPLDFSKLPYSILNHIKVPVIAVLGKTTLLTSELNLLEIGDVVALDTAINSPLLIYLGNFLKLQVQPGIKNKKRAVRIASLEEEKITIAPPLAEKEEKPEAPAEPQKGVEEKPPEEEILTEELPEEEFEISEEEEFPEEEVFPEEEEEFFDEEEKYGS
ncbi:MAG: FliM/FliN family flagellar motor switch protein [Candidatus Margulisiibacteriota bacterium]